MTIEVIGTYPAITRLTTGFYSLDRAFVNDVGDIGVPVGHCWELFGTSGIGKSTFVQSLAGILAEIQKKNIVLCDFEGIDQKFVVRILTGVGFSGKINFPREENDEKQAEKMTEILAKSDYSVAILDSISAISPIGEQQGEIGERNMGQRAFIMAQVSRRALHIFRFADKEPKTLLLVNHWIPKLGSRGYVAPGGEVKSFLATTRISLKRIEEYPDGSYVLQGEVKKNRWGFQDRKFYSFILSAKGMHKGLTALYDCVIAEKAEYKSGIVKMNGESLGRLSKFVKEAKEGNNDIFNQFYTALAENTDNRSPQDEEFVGTKDISED